LLKNVTHICISINSTVVELVVLVVAAVVVAVVAAAVVKGVYHSLKLTVTSQEYVDQPPEQSPSSAAHDRSSSHHINRI
jgi:hypothetical protein